MRKISLIILFFLPSLLFGQTVIYRSIQINKTSALATGAGNNLTISGSTATFASALPDSIGVGDVIQYDADANGTVDNLAFIHGRTSSTVYTVKDSLGATTNLNAVTNDQDWSIFRSYINLNFNESGTENTGVADALENFDTGNRNIVTANEQWHFACYRGLLGGGAQFDAWTTGTATSNPNNYVRMYAPYLSSEVGTSQRHAGVFVSDNASASLSGSASGSFIIAGSTVGRFIIEGIQVSSLATTPTGIRITSTVANAKYEIKSCIIKAVVNPANNDGIAIDGATNPTTVLISNNIIYDWANRAGILLNQASVTVYAHNNTIVDNGNGLQQTAGTFNSVNNLAHSNGVDFTGSFTAEYNASSDGTAPGTNSRTSQTFTFVNEAGNNFQITIDDAGALDFGKNISADSNLPVTVDIVNTARPQPTNGSFDIGASEVEQAATGRIRKLVQ